MGDVRELAETLKKAGLAMSESHAKEMAENISSTGKRVHEDFEAKKEDVTTGPKRNLKMPIPATSDNPYMKEKIREMRRNAVQGQPVNVQVDYETPDMRLDEVDSPEEKTGRAIVQEELPPEKEQLYEQPVVEEKVQDVAYGVVQDNSENTHEEIVSEQGTENDFQAQDSERIKIQDSAEEARETQEYREQSNEGEIEINEHSEETPAIEETEDPRERPPEANVDLGQVFGPK